MAYLLRASGFRKQFFIAFLSLASFIFVQASAADIDSTSYSDKMVVINEVSPSVAGRYPYGVVFLPKNKLDSVLRYADTELVPIIFKRDKTELVLPNSNLDSLVNIVNKLLSDRDLEISYVWIGGSASPEGPEKHNEWLGKMRAKRLYDYLKTHTQLPDSLIRVENLMEDWQTPLRLIQGYEFPHKEEVLRIWREQPDNSLRKREIIAIDKGKTWEYLIDKPFRPARNARMMIVCSAEDSAMLIKPKFNVSPDTSTILSDVNIGTIPMPRYRSQFVAVKTNIAALSLLVANLGIEFSFGRGFSLDVPVYYSPYDITSKFRVRVLGTQPELRYWLKRDLPGDGHYFGLNGTVAGFNISFPHTDRFQDPEHALWGAGLSYGYALNFGKWKCWGIDFNIGVGYFNYHLDTFQNIHNGKLLHTQSKDYWGITRAGISLTYKWRRSQPIKPRRPKEGASL